MATGVRGRRPGSSGTKAAILASARRAFSARGFDGTTMREIARDAGVDAALLHHFYGSKRDLYRTVLDVAAMTDASAPVAGASGGAGERIVRAFVDRWDAADGPTAFAALVRAAGSDPEAHALLVETIARTVVLPALAALEPGTRMPKMRASLVGAQLLGLGWLRYAAKVVPLATASSALVARTFGPSLDATLGAAPGSARA